MCKIRRKFTVVNGSSPKSDVEEYWDGEICWITPEDLSLENGIFIHESRRTITQAGYESCGTKLVPKGSIVLSTRAPIGHVKLAGRELCTNQGCKTLVKKGSDIDENYIYYYLSCTSDVLNSMGQGSTFLELSNENLSNYEFPIPPLELQEQISDFLKDRTKEVYHLISKQYDIIELLKEKRQAIITNAVTKGRDPNVPMKDSGIEWIGEIPEHWEFNKIKRVAYVKGRIGWKGLTSSEYLEKGYAYLVTGEDFIEKKINWDSCYQVDELRYRDDPYIQLREGDLLVTKDGTIGKLAIVQNLNKPACLNSGIFLVRPVNSYISDFLYWILCSRVFSDYNGMKAMGSTVQHLYQNVFEEFAFPMPSIAEQKQLVNYLNIKTDEIDSLIVKLQKLIDNLKELKSSLISSAVTGKIDVRGISL